MEDMVGVGCLWAGSPRPPAQTHRCQGPGTFFALLSLNVGQTLRVESHRIQ